MTSHTNIRRGDTMRLNPIAVLMYGFAVGVTCFVMRSLGSGADDWRYWTVLLCTMLSHLAGGSWRM